jgi:lipoprotein NlpI
VAVAPNDGYVVLWQTIVRGDAAVADSDLAARAAKVDPAKWPGALVKLYQGQADITATMREARAAANPDLADGRICEANFYIAELQRLQGHAELAPPLLRAAAADCPVEYIEKRVAAFLLKATP